MTPMTVTAAGRALIEQREGKRLAAYRDSRGILTIGVGHTGRMAPPPATTGMRIDDAQCDAFLAADLAPVEAVIAKRVAVPISAEECDALASLGFNIGTGGLAKSSVIRKLNLGDVQGAADAFLLWSKPAELAGRRRDERAQFLTPDTAIAIARGTALQHAATQAHAGARAATKRAASLAGAGVPSAGAAIAAGHGTAGAVIGLVAVLAAAFDGWLAHHRTARAATLLANAAAHLDAHHAAAAA